MLCYPFQVVTTASAPTDNDSWTGVICKQLQTEYVVLVVIVRSPETVEA